MSVSEALLEKLWVTENTQENPLISHLKNNKHEETLLTLTCLHVQLHVLFPNQQSTLSIDLPPEHNTRQSEKTMREHESELLGTHNQIRKQTLGNKKLTQRLGMRCKSCTHAGSRRQEAVTIGEAFHIIVIV